MLGNFRAKRKYVLYFASSLPNKGSPATVLRPLVLRVRVWTIHTAQQDEAANTLASSNVSFKN